MEGLLPFAQRRGRARPGSGDGLECQQDAAFGVDLEVADRRKSPGTISIVPVTSPTLRSHRPRTRALRKK